MSPRRRQARVGRPRNLLQEEKLTPQHIEWLSPLRAHLDRRAIKNETLAVEAYMAKSKASMILTGRWCPPSWTWS
ncbi:hypothetical protein OG930_38855 [Streptomyces sp. NBC_01799]|uniref:hypothetical protein n=1 Tax=Streptomyces sp. NBC_01800 TaxID=2975945 RepID=UPI002DDB1575|nr:hypothetical protein [Streptomyces sp. NBC_01800]WSA72511.1 hypothetical protein OIE65_39470 [Streptomyces sp. NBC_01800]WSA81036.1 hypothetical protein OG930_38855 [Streptomyces sp. NBC_01799]